MKLPIDNSQLHMDVGSGEHGSLWIFIHGTDVADRGLIVLFSVFFCFFSVFFPLSPPPWKRLNSAIFSIFCYFPLLPSPLEIFLPTPLQLHIGFCVSIYYKSYMK